MLLCVQFRGIELGCIIKCVALDVCSPTETGSECEADSPDACCISKELISAWFLFLSDVQRGDVKITDMGRPVWVFTCAFVCRKSEAGCYVHWPCVSLPSLTAASVVWSGRPGSTWTAVAPPRCKHTFPHYPGLNCTPAMIPLDLLVTPEDKRVDE